MPYPSSAFTGTFWTIQDGDFYVSTTGNDITGTGSPNNPLLTVAKAFELATDNQKIVIGPNEYIAFDAGSDGTGGALIPCRLATVTNIPLSGLVTVDGIATNDGDRVLVWKQNLPLQNGIYIVSTGAWQREPAFSTADNMTKGVLVPIAEGNTNSKYIYQHTTVEDITVGLTEIVFENGAVTDWGGIGGDITAQTDLNELIDDKADRSNVLERDNVGVYTPTSDYHPATKKFTEDAIAALDKATPKGLLDCSENPDYPVGAVGDYYYVSVAGKIGGASGIVVEAFDRIQCLIDSPSGNQAIVGNSWMILQGNLNKATQSEAEAGTDNEKFMTPLRVQNAWSAFSGGLLWPSSDGTDGQLLQTNGAGQLSFVDAEVLPIDSLSGDLTEYNFALESDDTRGKLIAILPDGSTIDDAILGLTDFKIPNEILIEGNTIWIAYNYIDDGSEASKIVRLENVSIDETNGVINYTIADSRSLSQGGVLATKVHGFCKNENHLFLTTRENPFKLVKIHKRNFADIAIQEYPNDGKYKGGDICVYNRGFIFVYATDLSYTDKMRIVKINSAKIDNYEVLIDNTTSGQSTLPAFLEIYNNEIITVESGFSDNFRISRYSMKGELILSSVIDMTPTDNGAIHSGVVYDGHVILLGIYAKQLLKIRLSDLVEVEQVSIPNSATDDMALGKDGFLYIGTEKLEYAPPNSSEASLYKIEIGNLSNISQIKSLNASCYAVATSYTPVFEIHDESQLGDASIQFYTQGGSGFLWTMGIDMTSQEGDFGWYPSSALGTGTQAMSLSPGGILSVNQLNVGTLSITQNSISSNDDIDLYLGVDKNVFISAIYEDAHSNDKMLSLLAELDTGNGSDGTDIFSLFYGDIIEYDITGWDQINLLKLKYNGDDRFRVDKSGDTEISGGLRVEGTVILSGELNLGSNFNLLESIHRSGLLQINATSDSWAGIMVNTSDTLWAFMGSDTNAGIYDDTNDKWCIRVYENSRVDLYFNNSVKLTTTETGIQVNGVGVSDTNWVISSDQRLKAIQDDLPDAMHIVRNLQGHRFMRTDLNDDIIRIGFMAQQVADFLPEVVQVNEDKWTMDYASMTALHNEALKTVDNELDMLKKKVSILELKLAENGITL